MKQINIGIIGFGTIGRAVVKAIKENNSVLSKRVGSKINIKAVCDKNSKVFKNSGLSKSIIKKKAGDIVKDPEINVIVELIGGIHPAKEIIIKALKNKKDVITANKALLADHKKELFQLASKNNVGLYFEASVLAGVPVIKVLQEALAGSRIKSMCGVINGTSNYILSNMHHKGISFKESLREAQKKGFAEKDYSFDVEGIDSAHKLAIISSLAFGQDIKLKDINVEGISNISLRDIMYAKELGFTIKLLAIAKNLNDFIDVRVHPTLLPENHMLSKVSGAYNAIYIQSDLVKNLFLYGEGAGGSSTSSAVLSDIADIVSGARCFSNKKIKSLAKAPVKAKRVKKIDELYSSYYIRFMAVDKPGVLAKISGILGRHKMSIASVMQKVRKKSQTVPIIMLTHKLNEYNLKRALAEIDRLPFIKAKSVAIKIEQEI